MNSTVDNPYNTNYGTFKSDVETKTQKIKDKVTSYMQRKPTPNLPLPAPKPPAFDEAAVQADVERALAQMTSYHTALDSDFYASTARYKYLIGKTANYMHIRNRIGGFTVKAPSIKSLKDYEQGVTLAIPKVPYHMLETTIAFFREIYKKYKSEAMVQFYFDEELQEYFMNCPEQVVSGGSVNFKRDLELDAKYLLVMDIHSHHTMGAFFSGTDNADEKETRLFGVIGKITSNPPEMKFRAIVGGVSVDLTVDDIFESPLAPEYSIPAEWFEACKEHTVALATTNNVPTYTRVLPTHEEHSIEEWEKIWDERLAERMSDVYYPTGVLPDEVIPPTAGNSTGVRTLGNYLKEEEKVEEIEEGLPDLSLELQLRLGNAIIELLPPDGRVEIVKSCIETDVEDVALALLSSGQWDDVMEAVKTLVVESESIEAEVIGGI